MKFKKYYDQQNDGFSKKLMSYAGMSGAFLAATAPQAKGQVEYTDVDPDTVIIDGTYDIDMNNDLSPDYVLQQFMQTGGNMGAKFGAPLSNLSNEFMGTVGPYGYYYPSKLSSGAPINSGGNFLQVANAPGYEPSLVFAYATGATYGNWNIQSGYVGVHFFVGGNDHYGWVELYVDTNGQSITLRSYAYEMTPSTGIIAGDTVGSTGINTPNGEPVALQAGRISPNPVHDGPARIEVEALKSRDVKLEIYNGMGALVYSDTRFLVPGKNPLEIDVKTLSGGAYFLKISDESTSLFRKLVIAH